MIPTAAQTTDSDTAVCHAANIDSVVTLKHIFIANIAIYNCDPPT